MRKLIVALPIVALIGAGIAGLASRSSDAGLLGTEHLCIDEIDVTRNPGNDPILWPANSNFLITLGDQTNSHAPLAIEGPQPNSPSATKPHISGQVDMNTGQVTASGTAMYFFPANVSFNGMMEFDQGVPQSLSGTYMLKGSPQPPPDIDFAMSCTVVQPTPSPSPTPSDDEYSITVLKLNSATHGPLAAWEIELFGNDDCSGTPIDSGVTDNNGLIDFTGLVEGTYSLKEEERAGFTPDGDLCQTAFVGDAAGAAAGVASIDDLPPCPTSNLPFPEPGCDDFDSGAQVNIDFSPIGGTEPEIVTLNGPTRIARGAVGDGDGDGRDQVQTEIIGMSLVGTTSVGPATVMQSPTRPSNGAFEEQNNATTGTMDFPADSFFDVFVEVDLPQMNMVLHNTQPIRMQCIIFQIPPEFCLYQPPISEPIELFNEQDQLVALIVHAAHIPLPKNEILVVFNNSPGLVQGNVDCNVSVNSVDSLKLLRWVALLSVSQEADCPLIGDEVASFWGDVDCSGAVNSVDSLKILRFVALLSVVQTEPCPDIGMPIAQ